MTTKAFVWQGRGVLKQYSTGKAVVLAKDVGEAWVVLKSLDFEAYWQLRTGTTNFRTESEYLSAVEETRKDPNHWEADALKQIEPGYPIQPREYSLGITEGYSRDPDGYRPREFHGLVCWGGE